MFFIRKIDCVEDRIRPAGLVDPVSTAVFRVQNSPRCADSPSRRGRQEINSVEC